VGNHLYNLVNMGKEESTYPIESFESYKDREGEG